MVETLVVDAKGKTLLGTTAKGKEIYYASKNGMSVRMLCFGDGGEMPKCLSGGYTSIRAAQADVSSYLAGKDKVAPAKSKGKKKCDTGGCKI